MTLVVRTRQERVNTVCAWADSRAAVLGGDLWNQAEYDILQPMAALAEPTERPSALDFLLVVPAVCSI